jgi:hypothetical protein
VTRSTCDVCRELAARELTSEDRSALPTIAPWIRLMCERCLDRVRRNAGKAAA